MARELRREGGPCRNQHKLPAPQRLGGKCRSRSSLCRSSTNQSRERGKICPSKCMQRGASWSRPNILSPREQGSKNETGRRLTASERVNRKVSATRDEPRCSETSNISVRRRNPFKYEILLGGKVLSLIRPRRKRIDSLCGQSID